MLLGHIFKHLCLGSVLAQNIFMPQGFALFLLLRHSKKNAPPRCGFVSVKLMVTEGCSQANRGPRKVPQRGSSAKAFLMMLKRGHFVGYHGESVALSAPPNLAASTIILSFGNVKTELRINTFCGVVRIPCSSSATAKKMRPRAVGSHFSAVAEEEGFEPSNRF